MRFCLIPTSCFLGCLRKQGCMPIPIPKHESIKEVYVEMVRQVVESEGKNDEDIG